MAGTIPRIPRYAGFNVYADSNSPMSFCLPKQSLQQQYAVVKTAGPALDRGLEKGLSRWDDRSV